MQAVRSGARLEHVPLAFSLSLLPCPSRSTRQTPPGAPAFGGALSQSTLPLSAAFSLAVLHGVLTGDPQLLAAAPESSQLWTLLPAPVQLHSQGRGIPAALGASPALRKPGWSLPLGVSVTSQSRDLKRLSSHGLLHPLLLAASTPWAPGALGGALGGSAPSLPEERCPRTCCSSSLPSRLCSSPGGRGGELRSAAVDPDQLMGDWEGRAAGATISGAVPVLISQQFFWSFGEKNLPACAPSCSLLPGGRRELLDTTPKLPVLSGQWGETVLWGEAISAVTGVDSPSSKGWGMFSRSQGLPSAGGLHTSTPHRGFFLLPSRFAAGAELAAPPASTQCLRPALPRSVQPGRWAGTPMCRLN